MVECGTLQPTRNLAPRATPGIRLPAGYCSRRYVGHRGARRRVRVIAAADRGSERTRWGFVPPVGNSIVTVSFSQTAERLESLACGPPSVTNLHPS